MTQTSPGDSVLRRFLATGKEGFFLLELRLVLTGLLLESSYAESLWT